ncbi:MAG: hypothetical protein ACFFBD_16895 [Candidatus Hodarchaeota archaeon]
MFKTFGKKDLEFFEDRVFDPQTKIYMRVLTAPLKHVRTSSISLLGLLSPLTIELLPAEDKTIIILYSLNVKELDARTKLATRYLSEIFPSTRLLRGHHLKILFSSIKLIPYKDETFWAQNNRLYVLYDMSNSSHQVKQFTTWYMKNRRNADLKIRLSFMTARALLLTKKNQKKRFLDEANDNFSFDEKLAQMEEFRGIEVFAMATESYQTEFSKKTLEEAYVFLQQNNFQSFLKEVSLSSQIRTRYPSKDSSIFPVAQGLNVLSNLIAQITHGFLDRPMHTIPSKPVVESSPNPSSRVLTRRNTSIPSKPPPQTIANLAVILRTSKGDRVFIDPSAIGTIRLALLQLVLQPAPSSDKNYSKDREDTFSGPYSITGFSKCVAFMYRGIKDTVPICVWLVVPEKKVRQILNSIENVEWFLTNWAENLDLTNPINVKDLNIALSNFLNQSITEMLVSA